MAIQFLPLNGMNPELGRPAPINFDSIDNALLQLNNNKYKDEAVRQQNARLAMEQEKFGWSRDEEAAHKAAADWLANHPGDFEGARTRANRGGSLPTTSTLYGMETAADTLRNNQGFRAAMGGPTPGGRGRSVLPSSYATPESAPAADGATTPLPGVSVTQPKPNTNAEQPDPFAPGNIGHLVANSTANYFKDHVLGAAAIDPRLAEQRYNDFRTHPSVAEHFAKAGYGTGDWLAEAKHVYDDAQARATGQAPPPPFVPMATAANAPATTPVPGIAVTQPQAQPTPTAAPKITAADFDKMVRTAMAEDNNPAGWKAVTGTVLNRSKAAGVSPSDIVQAPGQFTPWQTKRAQLEGIDRASPEYQRVAQAIAPIVTGQEADPTNGATHYYAPGMMPTPPAWAQGQQGTDLGNQRFYKLPYSYRGPQAQAAGAAGAGAPDVAAAPGAVPPPAGIAPGQPAPLDQLPELPEPPRQQLSATPAQQIATQLLDKDRRDYRTALAYGRPEAKDMLARLQEMEKSGQYYVPSGFGVPAQMVDLPGVLEKKTAEKIATETAGKDADLADRVYTGFTGQRAIASAQKMNIGIVKTLLDDPNLAVGTAQGSQLWYQRAMSTLAEKFPGLGIDPNKAVNREIFNQTLTRILGDQFAGLKSTSGTAGEQASRIFAPMLGIEEKALPNETDTIAGIRAKVGILDQVGDHMMEWGNLADAYKAKYGRLDPTFYTWINDRISKARIAGYEGHDMRSLPIPNPSAAIVDKDGRVQGVRPAGQHGQDGEQQPQRLTPQHMRDAPIGTEAIINGQPVIRSVGPNGQLGWTDKPTAPNATPEMLHEQQRRAQMSPAERSAAIRSGTLQRPQAPTVSPAQTAQAAAPVQSAFDQDKATLPPDQLAIKYQAALRMLRPDQQQAFQEALNAAVPMGARR